jgi:hypothetical protein
MNVTSQNGESDVVDDIESNPLRERVRSALSIIPAPVRKVLVAVTGAVLILIGISLIWLPGPFTLPFVIAGVVILSTEFVWASSILKVGQEQSARLFEMLRNPWILLAVLLAIAVAVTTAYTLVRPGWWH